MQIHTFALVSLKLRSQFSKRGFFSKRVFTEALFVPSCRWRSPLTLAKRQVSSLRNLKKTHLNIEVTSLRYQQQSESEQSGLEQSELEQSGLEQSELIKWMPITESQNSIFSVYRAENAIEIHAGCEERRNARLVCTHYAYDDAREFSELLAQQAGLPVRDYTHQFP